MKKKRSYPFGYAIRNGALIVDEREAAIVRRIFEEYQSGASIARVALTLNGLGIPYSETRRDWNKATVARILADQRYIGADGFERIVDPAIFYLVNQSKQSRNTRLLVDNSGSVELLRNKVVCAQCGSPMTRIYDASKKKPVVWRCTMPTCNVHIPLLDAALENQIRDRMNLIIHQPQLLDTEQCSDRKEQNEWHVKETDELRRMCDSGHYSDEQLLVTILENARKRYECCAEDQNRVSNKLYDAFISAEPCEELDADLFKRTVTGVLLGSNGAIQLRLVNEKIV